MRADNTFWTQVVGGCYDGDTIEMDDAVTVIKLPVLCGAPVEDGDDIVCSEVQNMSWETYILQDITLDVGNARWKYFFWLHTDLVGEKDIRTVIHMSGCHVERSLIVPPAIDKMLEASLFRWGTLTLSSN